MAPEVGTEAPDFTLKGSNNQEVTLSSFRGRQSVLVVFYPFAFSRICTGELCIVRDDLSSFQNADVQILAVSVDHPSTLKAYAERRPTTSPCSPTSRRREGRPGVRVFNDEAGMALRGTFLVERDGVVRFAEINAPGEARDQAGWKKALDALAA